MPPATPARGEPAASRTGTATLRMASRGSRLALAQAALAAGALADAAATEVVTIETEGDRDRETPLTVLGGRGVFVKAVQEAVLDGRAELAVHSLKDVPTDPAEGLVIGAVLRRGDARDALVASGGRRLAELPAGARVGTSSGRRAALLRALRPDLQPVEVRGNVDTRLRLVEEGRYAALLLALAGLVRLGRADAATQIFDAGEFLPAPGQGAIAIECRADDERALALLAAADHAPTRAAVEAERGVLVALGSGCALPVGAHAVVDGDLLALRGMLAGPGDGLPLFGDAAGPVAQAARLGRGLGERLRDALAERDPAAAAALGVAGGRP